MILVEKNVTAEELIKYAKEYNYALVHNDENIDYYDYNDRFNMILNLSKRLGTSFDCIKLGDFKVGIVFNLNESKYKIINDGVLKTAINSLYGLTK